MRKDKEPWVKLFYQSWLIGVNGLTPAQRGVYQTVLCMIYEKGRAIRRDDRRLARGMCCSKPMMTAILDELIDQGHLIETDGFLSNGKAQEVLEDRQDRIEKATAASAVAATLRGQKNKRNQRTVSPPDDRKDTDKEEDKEKEKKKETDDDDSGAPALDKDAMRGAMLQAIGVDPVSGVPPDGSTTALGNRVDMEMVETIWIGRLGLSRETIIAVLIEVMAKKRDGWPSTFRYFNKAIEEEAKRVERMKEEPREQAQPAHRPATVHQLAPRDHREAARSDALSQRIEGAARHRSPSKGGIRFGRDDHSS